MKIHPVILLIINFLLFEITAVVFVVTGTFVLHFDGKFAYPNEYLFLARFLSVFTNSFIPLLLSITILFAPEVLLASKNKRTRIKISDNVVHSIVIVLLFPIIFFNLKYYYIDGLVVVLVIFNGLNFITGISDQTIIPSNKYRDRSIILLFGVVYLMPCLFFIDKSNFFKIILILFVSNLSVYAIIRYNILLYPIHLYKMYQCEDFEDSPLFNSSGIYFPLWGAKKLYLMAKLKPQKAVEFSEKIFQNHPNQYKLGAEIQHIAISKLLFENPFKVDFMQVPFIPETVSTHTPTNEWLILFQKMKDSIILFQTESNIHSKLSKYKLFCKDLIDFGNINSIQLGTWKKYYIAVIEQWALEANQKMKALEKDAISTISNPYHVGDPLVPSLNSAVFLGREDLRETLRASVNNSTSIPMILLQGQRRVGKTSVLNFLPSLLGERCKVITLNLQDSSNCNNIQIWMQSIRSKFNKELNIEEDVWIATTNWIKSWENLRQHLLINTKENHFKIILAFDEYEALHENGLKTDPEQGKRLLGAMRSFSQEQDKIVFLFSGSALFSELENPRWSDYFVGALHRKVDYLSIIDTKKLISSPYPDFPITYEDKAKTYIFDITQGHPALVQLICYELVQFANAKNEKKLKLVDVKKIVNENIIIESNSVLNVFWKQFCASEDMKNVVRQVIQGEEVMDKEKLKKLIRHDFVVSDSAKKHKMRVPLFNSWIKKFGMD